jgi:hypothetical protein
VKTLFTTPELALPPPMFAHPIAENLAVVAATEGLELASYFVLPVAQVAPVLSPASHAASVPSVRVQILTAFADAKVTSVLAVIVPPSGVNVGAAAVNVNTLFTTAELLSLPPMFAHEIAENLAVVAATEGLELASYFVLPVAQLAPVLSVASHAASVPSVRKQILTAFAADAKATSVLAVIAPPSGVNVGTPAVAAAPYVAHDAQIAATM